MSRVDVNTIENINNSRPNAFRKACSCVFDNPNSTYFEPTFKSKTKIPANNLLLFILFALVKAIVPRYRYDQLMKLGWKIFLPFSLIWVVLTAGYLLYFDLLPGN